MTAYFSISTESEVIKVDTKDNIQENTPLRHESSQLIS